MGDSVMVNVAFQQYILFIYCWSVSKLNCVFFNLQENSWLQPIGYIELDLPKAPKKATRPPPQAVDPYLRYGPKAEIAHIFRVPEKRPPQEVSFAFLGLVFVPFLAFLVGVSPSSVYLLILDICAHKSGPLDYLVNQNISDLVFTFLIKEYKVIHVACLSML